MSNKPPIASITVRGGSPIELSQDDFDTLLFALGLLVSGYLRDGRKGLALRIVELANKMNKNNPRWIPYDTTADERTDLPTGATSRI
jgi:hypothetical protein